MEQLSRGPAAGVAWGVRGSEPGERGRSWARGGTRACGLQMDCRCMSKLRLREEEHLRGWGGGALLLT